MQWSQWLSSLLIINFNTALLRMQESEQESNKCCLARTGLPQYSRRGSRGEIKRKIPDHISISRIILKSNALHPDAARRIQLYRITLFFHRIVFQFHQSFRSSIDADISGDQLRQIAGGALDAIYQLQKSRHTTKRKGMTGHPDSSPEKSQQIAEGKTCIKDQITEYPEFRASYDTMPEMTLCVFQPSYHDVITLKGLN